MMTRFLPSPPGVCAWSPQRRRLRAAAAAEPAGAGKRRAGGRKEARERRGLGAPQCHSNSVPGRSPQGPSSCPAVAHCIERVVCAEPPRGGRLGAGLSGGSAEPLGCRGVLDAGCLRAAAAASCFARAGSPGGSAACPTSCRFQGAQQQPGPVPCGLSPGKGRAASAHLSFVRSRAGIRGKELSLGISLCCGGLE